MSWSPTSPSRPCPAPAWDAQHTVTFTAEAADPALWEKLHGSTAQAEMVLREFVTYYVSRIGGGVEILISETAFRDRHTDPAR